MNKGKPFSFPRQVLNARPGPTQKNGHTPGLHADNARKNFHKPGGDHMTMLHVYKQHLGPGVVWLDGLAVRISTQSSLFRAQPLQLK